jgi:hypothetical protein
VTARYPGVLQQIEDDATALGITVEEALTHRDVAALTLLLAAETGLAGIRGHLDAIGDAGLVAGACEAPVPVLGKTCGQAFPRDLARREHGAWACDLHAGHECPATANGDSK